MGKTQLGSLTEYNANLLQPSSQLNLCSSVRREAFIVHSTLDILVVSTPTRMAYYALFIALCGLMSPQIPILLNFFLTNQLQRLTSSLFRYWQNWPYFLLPGVCICCFAYGDEIVDKKQLMRGNVYFTSQFRQMQSIMLEKALWASSVIFGADQEVEQEELLVVALLS